MFADVIASKAEEMAKKYDTRNPFQLAKDLGIDVMFRDDYTTLKGMYTVVLRNRVILINDNMSERMKRIVCAHELGHDTLHRDLAAKMAMQEFILYRMDTRPEYEANIFAANFLLPDDDVLDYIKNYQYDSEQIARAMRSDINLVALKVDNLIRRGYNLRPQESKSNFLK